MTTPNDFAQLIGTDTPNAPSGAYLCCTYTSIANTGNPESYRVHFNVPEGTQRFCGDAPRIRMPRTDLVMLTRFRHDTVMGLPGYVLTAQDGILTGKQKALTGKLAMGGKKKLDNEEEANDNAVSNTSHGVTNRQRAAMAEAAAAGKPLSKADKPAVSGHPMGRTFLVGAPVPHQPLRQWWAAMNSMYFHYRTQGVVDLAFLGTDGNGSRNIVATGDDEQQPSSLLFALALNGDSINGIANSDYYRNADGTLMAAATFGKPAASSSSSGCCGGQHGNTDAHAHASSAGHKRSRSEEEAAASSAPSTPPSTIANLAPAEAIKRLVKGSASHLVCFDTTTSTRTGGAASSSSGLSTTASVASYWARFPPPPPAFDHKVAKEVFGIMPGPKYGALKHNNGAVASDTLKNSDGTPLMVTLADVARAAAEIMEKKAAEEAAKKAAAAGLNGSTSSSANTTAGALPMTNGLRAGGVEWSNMLVVDGDDEVSIMAGLVRAMVAMRATLQAENSTGVGFGRLTLVMVLCPATVTLSKDFTQKVAQLFYAYSVGVSTEVAVATNADDDTATTSNTAPAVKILTFPAPQHVTARDGLLSADAIGAKAEVEVLVNAAGVAVMPTVNALSTVDIANTNITTGQQPAKPLPSAFPTALAHRYHLSALASDYFPLQHGNASEPPRQEEEDAVIASVATAAPNNNSKAQQQHSLTMTTASKVWWPYSILYRIVDGTIINAPRVDVLNRALVDDAFAAKYNSDGQEQDPPLRYPDYDSSVEMLSEAFKKMVVGYGEENSLQDLAKVGGVSSSNSTGKVNEVAEVTTPTTSPNAATPAEATNHMLFLGTGSAVPSKYRNVSGLVVGTEANGPAAEGLLGAGSIHPLLRTTRLVCDFGEGSMGQWSQFLSNQTYDVVAAAPNNDSSVSAALTPVELALLTLRAMFVSHNHADHVLGVFALIDNYVRVCTKVKALAAAKKKGSTTLTAEDAYCLALAQQPLMIICPRNFRDFLQRTVPILCPAVLDAAAADVTDDAGNIVFVKRFATAIGAKEANVWHLGTSITTTVTSDSPTPASPNSYYGDSASANNSSSVQVYAIDLEPLTVTTPLGAVPLGEDGVINATTGAVSLPRLFLQQYLRHYYGPNTASTIIPVDHPAHAHGLFFRNSSEWSWCYSGDTRPWPLLNAVANTPTYTPLRVLVHECTFDDDLQGEAVYKKHSTLSEALGAGVNCGAEHVLLNHFSQRYPKIPPAAAAAASRLRQQQLAANNNATPAKADDEEDTAGTSATAQKESDVATAADDTTTANNAASAASPLPIIPFTFSFDGMLVPYSSGLHSGDLISRLPLFQWLLDEYDQWVVGTSQRLRGRREAAAIAGALSQKELLEKQKEEKAREKLEKQRAAAERHLRKQIPSKKQQLEQQQKQQEGATDAQSTAAVAAPTTEAPSA